MDNGQLWGAIRRGWLVVLIFLVVGLAASVLYLRLAPARYTASSSVYVSATGGEDVNELSAGSTFAQDQARNFSLIATREVVLQPATDQLGLDVPAVELAKWVTATVPSQSSIILIEATGNSPRNAADIADAVADGLIDTATTLLPPARRGAPAIKLQAVESAAVPSEPTSPDPRVGVPLGIGAGLVVGILAALGIDSRRSRTAGRPGPA